MLYKFFTNSERAWRAMFEAIKNAEESVYLEMYIFADDMVQYDFLFLLKEKARGGLRVKIILDSLGSRELEDSAIAELRESGVELIFLSYFLHRTHRKILIVDERRAFIGGVNLSQKFRFWNDLVVEASGKRLVRHITRSFAKVYSEGGGEDQAILSRNGPIILDKTRTWLVEHFPIKKKFNLKKIYKKHLNDAKKEIILVTPYFMPRHWLRGVLHQAVLRGVKVDILVPKTTDIFITDRVNYFYMFKLSKLGINFYLEPKMNHAKVMIIDSKEGIVGSNNLDFFSFELNSEVGIFLKDLSAVQKLSDIAKEWKREAVLFNFRHYKPRLFDHILSPIISLFTKIF
jgi:cardiolipin synthase